MKIWTRFGWTSIHESVCVSVVRKMAIERVILFMVLIIFIEEKA